MIHELLLALRGYPGGLFVGGGLQVSPEPPPFLHPSEAALLARVCRLGALYVRLHEFIEQFAEHAQPPLPPPAAPPQELLASPPGIYLRAFCTGLDAVLQPYRQALLGLEQEFLADPHLTISYVNYSLDQLMKTPNPQSQKIRILHAGSTPADDMAPQINTDCGNFTLDFKHLAVCAFPFFLHILGPWFSNEMKKLLASENRTLDH